MGGATEESATPCADEFSPAAQGPQMCAGGVQIVDSVGRIGALKKGHTDRDFLQNLAVFQDAAMQHRAAFRGSAPGPD